MDDQAMMNGESLRKIKLIEDHLARADALEKARQIDDAQAAYQECIEIARREHIPMLLPQMVHVWMGLGFCWADRNQWSQALDMYRRAEIALHSAIATLNDDASPKAQEKARQLAQFIPQGIDLIIPQGYDPTIDLVNAFESIALAYDNNGQLDQAQSYYDQLLMWHRRLNTPNGELRVWNYRAVSSQRRRDWPNLQAAAESMLELAQGQQHNPEARILGCRYLSQARFNQGDMLDAIENLALAIESERQVRHPNLANDEQIKANLVQGFVGLLRDKVSQSQPHRAPVPVDPTQFAPLQDLFSGITYEQSLHNGAPGLLFVVHTPRFEAAVQALGMFHLSPLPMNVRTLREMGAQGLPDDLDLWIEWRLADLDPNRPIGRTPIPLTHRDSLAALNGQGMTFSVVVQDDTRNRRSDQIVYAPYLLDWYGYEGTAVILRGTWQNSAQDEAASLIGWLNQRIQGGGLATGLLTQIGFAYRAIGAFDDAAQFYLKEIQVGLKPDGQPGPGVLTTLCNLGTVYKKKQDLERARLCYRLALQMNPNYFEVLVSLPGILDNLDWQLICLSRAYRIRPDDPILSMAVQNLCSSRPHTYQDIWPIVRTLSREIDLAQPFKDLALANPAEAVQSLLSSLPGPASARVAAPSGPLNTLDDVIRLLEQFAAVHMEAAPRLSARPLWLTAVEEQVVFHKDQDGKVRTYMSPGAQLSIAFNPELMIRVTLQPPNCSITVMEEFQMPDVPQPALKSVRDAAVPARAEALWAQLNEWVSRGTLYLANGRWHHRA